jgi:hypothetical protein
MENGTQVPRQKRAYTRRDGPIHPIGPPRRNKHSHKRRARRMKRRTPHVLRTGLLVLENIDMRTKACKAYLRLVDGVTNDLGGKERLSEVEKALVHAFASATIRMYDQSAKFLLGENVDLSDHAAAVSSMVRVASRLGVERRPRDVLPLASYLSSQKDDAGVEDAEILEDASE